MKTGISIYLSSPLQDIERTIERGAAAGARYAFTSLHIPEDGGAAYADKVRQALSLLSARGIALIADVGPRTCDLLGLERIEGLRDLDKARVLFEHGAQAVDVPRGESVSLRHGVLSTGLAGLRLTQQERGGVRE